MNKQKGKTIKNTPERGTVRYVVFKKKRTWYAVALEFNIVVSSNDPVSALNELFEAAEGYVAAFRKIKNPTDYDALNQEPDEEYEALWQVAYSTKQKDKDIPSPYYVFTAGILTQ